MYVLSDPVIEKIHLWQRSFTTVCGLRAPHVELQVFYIQHETIHKIDCLYRHVYKYKI